MCSLELKTPGSWSGLLHTNLSFREVCKLSRVVVVLLCSNQVLVPANGRYSHKKESVSLDAKLVYTSVSAGWLLANSKISLRIPKIYHKGWLGCSEGFEFFFLFRHFYFIIWRKTGTNIAWWIYNNSIIHCLGVIFSVCGCPFVCFLPDITWYHGGMCIHYQ